MEYKNRNMYDTSEGDNISVSGRINGYLLIIVIILGKTALSEPQPSLGDSDRLIRFSLL
jgi:hypothetical protein